MGTKVSAKKLYCNGLMALTPCKSAEKVNSESILLPSLTTAGYPDPVGVTRENNVNDINALPNSTKVPDPARMISGSVTISPEMDKSNYDLVKRHSLSLRSPPFNSIAYNIINTPCRIVYKCIIFMYLLEYI